MNVSEHSTVSALEEVLDLLRGEEPDNLLALQRVESILQQKPCAKEVQMAGIATADIIETLLLPVLSQDKTRLNRAKTLQESLRGKDLAESEELKNGDLAKKMQAQQEEILKEMNHWVIDCSAPNPIPAKAPTTKQADGESNPTAMALPRTLFARMTHALRLICESEEQLGETVAAWQKEADPPWEEVVTVLSQVQSAGHKAAEAPWMRQRRVLYNELLQLVRACERGVTSPGTNEEVVTQPRQEINKPGNRLEAHRLQKLLYTQASELHTEARSLKRQQDESRERAEQLKTRLDELELALTQARNEQFLDPVTGIPDRFAFTAHLQRYLERGIHLKEVFSLILFHFHDLQQLLDTLDTQVGMSKRLVTALADEMRRRIPGDAFLARLSPERFVILLPKHTDGESEQVGTTIAGSLEDTRFRLDDKEVTVEVHCGYATYQPGMDATQMLEITDRLAASAHAQKKESQQEAQQLREC